MNWNPVVANHGDVLVFDSVSNSWINGVLSSSGPTGPPGSAGQSAYDIWLANGNSGTQQDFLNSLQGASGTNKRVKRLMVQMDKVHAIFGLQTVIQELNKTLNSLQGASGNNGTNGTMV